MIDLFLLIILLTHIVISCKYFVTTDFTRFSHVTISIASYFYATVVLDISSVYLFSLLMLLSFDFIAFILINKENQISSRKIDFFALTSCLLLVIPLIQPTMQKFIDV